MGVHQETAVSSRVTSDEFIRIGNRKAAPCNGQVRRLGEKSLR